MIWFTTTEISCTQPISGQPIEFKMMFQNAVATTERNHGMQAIPLRCGVDIRFSVYPKKGIFLKSWRNRDEDI